MSDVEYLTRVPAAVPAGRVLVHNRVRPTTRLGSRGFRAWLQPAAHNLRPCGCDWSGLHHWTPRLPDEERATG